MERDPNRRRTREKANGGEEERLHLEANSNANQMAGIASESPMVIIAV